MILTLEDGTKCRITNMFDCAGDETEDPAMACGVVAEHPNGTWIAQEVGPEMLTSEGLH